MLLSFQVDETDLPSLDADIFIGTSKLKKKRKRDYCFRDYSSHLGTLSGTSGNERCEFSGESFYGNSFKWSEIFRVLLPMFGFPIMDN